MKSTTTVKIAAIAATAFSLLGGMGSAIAQIYTTQEVDQDRFLTVAAPGTALIPYRLYLIEQRTNARPCFEVNPTTGEVNPLWTTFDFTGICGRSSDSNGYSIRVNNGDLGSQYQLQVRQSGGNLVLLGVPRDGSAAILIGRSNGIGSNGFTEINLNPGWRVTQRVFEGRTLGHFYYTNEATLAQLLDGAPVATDPGTRPPTTPPQTLPFSDIRGDVYATQIARAVEIGFVAGFQDGTFKPTQPVTREQAVSMIVEALLKRQPNLNIPTVPLGAAPFPDVAANRWSAGKIAFARSTGIVSGDQTGTFRPAAPVSRVELMAIMRRTAEYERQATGLSTTLEPTHNVFSFSDIGGHWGESVIRMMSGYCQIATPLNERGTAFAPNSPALRNYTSAAIVRLFDCTRPQ